MGSCQQERVCKKKEKSEIDGQKFYDVRDDEHTCIHNPRKSVSQCIGKKVRKDCWKIEKDGWGGKNKPALVHGCFMFVQELVGH